MNRQSVLVDFDGVIIDLLGSVSKILSERGISFNENNITSYKFDGNIGCDKQIVYALFNDVDTFKRAIPYTDALEALSKLKLYANVNPFTSVADNAEIIEYRSGLINLLGFNGTIDTPFVGQKPLLSGYNAVFEDDPYIAEAYSNSGVKTYLIDHTYNRDVNNENIVRCRNFSDAVSKYLSKLLVKKLN